MPNALLKQLEDELYRHGLTSFRKIRAARPNDKFYAFAFFTNGEYGYFATTASSHEGLERVARKYKLLDSYKDKSLDFLKLDLKWSPVDSPLHTECGEHLLALDETVQELQMEIDRRFDHDDEMESPKFDARINDACLRALQRIDAEGVFGGDRERKAVVVNLLKGDQSDEERIQFAKRVNPPEAVDMMERDLAAIRTE